MADETQIPVPAKEPVGITEEITEPAEAEEATCETESSKQAAEEVTAEEAAEETEEPAAESLSDGEPEEVAALDAPDAEASAEDTDGGPEEDAVPSYKGSSAASLLAGIIGCIVGMIISALAGGLGNSIGWFLVVAIPLCIGGLNLLLKGNRGAVGVAITAVFTAAGIYLLPSINAAAEVATHKGVSVLSAPLLALSMVGEANYITDIAFDSAHIFPIVYAVIGVLLAREFYKLKKKVK